MTNGIIGDILMPIGIVEGRVGDRFVEELKRLAEETSQAEIAKRTGLDQSTISRMLSGKRVGNIATMRKLLEAYPELGTRLLPENIPNSKQVSHLGLNA